MLYGGKIYPGALCVSSAYQDWCIIHDGTQLLPIHQNNKGRSSPNLMDSLDDVLNKLPPDCMFLDSICLADVSSWKEYGDGSPGDPVHCCPGFPPPNYYLYFDATNPEDLLSRYSRLLIRQVTFVVKISVMDQPFSIFSTRTTKLWVVSLILLNIQSHNFMLMQAGTNK